MSDVVWEITSCEANARAEVDKLLADGWEPFSTVAAAAAGRTA